MKDISEALAGIVADKGISEELARKIIEDTLRTAYRRSFGNDENAEVRFSEDGNGVTLYARKEVVDGVEDPSQEIEIDEARELNPEADIGDELLIEIDPADFGRASVANARQVAKTNIREIRKDSLFAEYKDKEGEIIIGYYQRERNGTIYVDLGKLVGVLPKKFQNPRESYHVNDRIKALIWKVEKTPTGLQIVLSRTHTEFVRAIFELEVPEVYDKTVEIHKIVREPGYRTKLSVYSNKPEVDPVGALVGMKGVRIQAVIRELEGEKIDVLKYDADPAKFIKNALSPADVRDVVILDEGKHKALAIVSDAQFSLAIGKSGLNVKLANRLTDWSIDVRTLAEYEKMDIYTENRKAASALFGESDETEEISNLSELPDVDIGVVEMLKANGIELIQDFIDASDDKLLAIPGMTNENIDAMRSLINKIEFIEEEEEPEESEAAGEPSETSAAESTDEEEHGDDYYECPVCGERITTDMTVCPKCGTELSFVYEDEEEEGEE
jgi:N utilization substance protein A